MPITIKNNEQIEYMRIAGRITAETLNVVEAYIKPGITTEELNNAAEEFIISKGAYPSFKGYSGYPASICASVNEEVIHGLPSKRKLVDGDIISIDVGVFINGYHGDAARTFAVGEIDDESQRLIDITRQSFFEGIKFAEEGYHLYDISKAIQNFVETNGFSVVRDYVGHGIGTNMHEPPQIPNYKLPGRGPKLVKGMTLAIEPMVNMKVFDVDVLDDGWTVVTRDGKRSAHYENTVLITGGKPEILTII